jgi:hypothetical protein
MFEKKCCARDSGAGFSRHDEDDAIDGRGERGAGVMRFAGVRLRAWRSELDDQA